MNPSPLIGESGASQVSAVAHRWEEYPRQLLMSGRYGIRVYALRRLPEPPLYSEICINTASPRESSAPRSHVVVALGRSCFASRVRLSDRVDSGVTEIAHDNCVLGRRVGTHGVF